MNEQPPSPASDGPGSPSGFPRWVGKVLKAEPGELGALLWSAAYFFFLLSGYYMIRPIRDEMAGDAWNLPWLYTGTLAAMLLINPVFSLIVSKFPRQKFIPYIYRFFGLNLLGFYFLFLLGDDAFDVKCGYAFYVWVAVFNLFVVSVFWGLMADLFSSDQAKRLFGFIAVGGSFGAMCGAYVTGSFATYLSQNDSSSLGLLDLMLVSIVLLELSAQCVRMLCKYARQRRTLSSQRDAVVTTTTTTLPESDQPVGGGVFSGMGLIIKSPYLLGICVFMTLYTISSTYLYFAKISVGRDIFRESADRVAFFADIDFYTNLLTIIVQIFFTSRILKGLGVGITLAFLPLVTLVGFGLMALALQRPELLNIVWVVTIFEAIRRSSNYALARPAREALYTVLSREEKYKSKSFIDTFVYRGGDQVGAWSQKLLVETLRFTPAALAMLMVPLAGLWIVVAVMLGARQKILARETEDHSPRGN